MKCEKCNEKEANFFYSATINGKTTEKHLCSECAAEEGLDKAFGFRDSEFENVFSRGSLFDSFFDEPFALMDSFFPRRGLFGSLMPTMTLPRILFAPLRTAGEAQTQEAPAQEASEKDIPKDAGEEVRRQRELNALKNQLQEAVKTENFEKAIELRDKIREMEK